MALARGSPNAAGALLDTAEILAGIGRDSKASALSCFCIEGCGSSLSLCSMLQSQQQDAQSSQRLCNISAAILSSGVAVVPVAGARTSRVMQCLGLASGALMQGFTRLAIQHHTLDLTQLFPQLSGNTG